MLGVNIFLAVAAIYRETNGRWAIFEVVYAICVAWIVSTLFYQVTTFGRHPGASMGWLVGMSIIGLVLYYTMKMVGKRILSEPVRKRPVRILAETS